MAKLIQFLVGLLVIINPLRNETKGQKIGTYVSLIASTLAVIVLALQIWGTPAPIQPVMVDAYVTAPYVVIHDTIDQADFQDDVCDPDSLSE